MDVITVFVWKYNQYIIPRFSNDTEKNDAHGYIISDIQIDFIYAYSSRRFAASWNILNLYIVEILTNHAQ